MALADAVLAYQDALIPLTAPTPLFSYAIAPPDLASGIDQREAAVGASEAIVGEMPDQLDPQDANLVAGSISADVAFAVDLLTNRPQVAFARDIAEEFVSPELLFNSFAFHPAKYLHEAVALLDKALHVDVENDKALGDTLQASIQPAYDTILDRVAKSLDKDLLAYGIDSTEGMLQRLEQFLPRTVIGELDHIEGLVRRLLNAAYAKALKFLGETEAQSLVTRIKNWLDKITGLESLTEDALNAAFHKDEHVHDLEQQVQRGKIDQAKATDAIAKLGQLTGHLTHTLDEIDASASLAERLGRYGALAGPLAPYVKAASLALPALTGAIALLLAVDYLDAAGDNDQGKVLNVAGVPTIIRVAVGDDPTPAPPRRTRSPRSSTKRPPRASSR